MKTGTDTGLQEHVVMWASQYVGKFPGCGTPKYKANMMTFDDSREATKFCEKLIQLQRDDGTYRGRKVVYVSPCF